MQGSTGSSPTVSIITVANYLDRLNLLRLNKSINQQTYKNIKEWIIFDQSEDAHVPQFSKITDRIKQKSNLKVVVLNQSEYRVEEDTRVEEYQYIALNKLVEAATSDIIVVMTDRDVYTERRVITAVNSLNKNISVSWIKNPLIVQLGNTIDESIIYSVGYPNVAFMYSIAFKRSVFNTHRFSPGDSCYGYCDQIIEKIVHTNYDNTDSQYKYESCNTDYSFMVSQIFTDDYYIRSTTNLPNNFNKLLKTVIDLYTLNLKSTCSKYLCRNSNCDGDDCPVCLCTTNTKLLTCGHSLCIDCAVKINNDARCPLCRKEYNICPITH